MRKLVAYLLGVFYLAFTTGVIVNAHYCMDQLAGVGLYQSYTDECDACGMHKDAGGCCHDDVSIVKIADLHQAEFFHYSFTIPAQLLPGLLDFQQDLNLKRAVLHSQLGRYNPSPPFGDLQETYLRNQVFRI